MTDEAIHVDQERPRDNRSRLTQLSGNASLLLQVIGKDRDASSFAALFKSIAPMIRSHLMRRGMSPASADEITQETFLIVWCKAHLFTPDGPALGWIYRIARNLCIDQHRRQVRTHEMSMLENPSWSPSPEDELSDKQDAAWVHATLKSLPAEFQEVLKLSYGLSQTHAEIAKGLGLPLGTVKSRIRRGL